MLVLAAASDLRRYLIPNWMPAVLALGAMVLAFPQSGEEWASRGLSFAVVAAVTVGLWLARTLGGGDVKLLSAAALWMPFSTLPTFALAVSVAGGVQALIVLVLRRVRPAPPAEGLAKRPLPYAVAIAAGGFVWAWERWQG